MRNRIWKKYLKLPSSEIMDSSDEINKIRIDLAISKLTLDFGKILCIGCADGYELQKLDKSVGLEINKISLKKCRKKGLKVIKGDMHEIPFKDKSFKTVFCRHTLEHSIATWIAFKEISRVSEKYILIVLPDFDLGKDSKRHFIIPNKEQIESMAKKCGFIIEKYWKIEDYRKRGWLFLKEDIYLLKRNKEIYEK